MPDIKVSITVFTPIPESKPAVRVETMIASRTFTFFKHKMHNSIIEITAGFVASVTMLSKFNRLLPPEEG